MTDEERRKLVARLLAHEVVMWTDIDLAADEIKRLAAELKQVESENEHHIRLAFVDAGANPARTWKEAAERLIALTQSDAVGLPNERGRND